MNNKDKKNTEKIIRGLQESTGGGAVYDDPILSLKNTIFNFFATRLETINEEESFKEEIKEAIRERIQERDDVSMAQLIKLYNDISSSSNFSINAIMDVFKPSKEGAVSPLVESQKSVDKQDNEPASSIPLSSSDAESIHTLTALLQEVQDKLREKKESTNNEEEEI